MSGKRIYNEKRYDFPWCAETEQGVFFGRLWARDSDQAVRLVKRYLINLGHTTIAEVRVLTTDVRTEFEIKEFNRYYKED